MIKIICNNEIPNGHVRIINEDGKEIRGVRSVDIRMRVNEIITARLDIEVNDISIQAEPLLSYNTIKKAAEYYGYQLVVKGT
jgi:hypothetical protein